MAVEHRRPRLGLLRAPWHRLTPASSPAVGGTRLWKRGAVRSGLPVP